MSTRATQADTDKLIPIGIEGLDEILRGGLVPYGLYLVEGDPGAGKTTLALQFMLAGIKRGERCMYVTLSEEESELRAGAHSHGWSLDGIHIHEIIASEESLKTDARYTMYHPSEVELAETTKAVLAEAARIKPDRMVLDSLSEFRMLADNPLRYRRQILSLKRYFARQQTTLLLLDDNTGEGRDMQLHSSAQGVISLTRVTPEFGSVRRQVQITKMRGRAFGEGRHDFVIRHGGLQVFPRLVAAEHQTPSERGSVESGIAHLDALLGGGLARGTSTLLIGAAGTGKSSLATQFVLTAGKRGEHAVMFLFDESIATFKERARGFGMEVEGMIEAGRLSLRQVDPAELSPGEFAHSLRTAVEDSNTRMVVIDSLNGYLNATPSERFLTLHIHELLTYLGQQGVTTLLLMTQHGMVGADVYVPIDASYLADAVISLRYFEAFGEVRQAISVIKKRTGKHERTIREMRFDKGIAVGNPVRDFEGVLTGFPKFVGNVLGAKKAMSQAPLPIDPERVLVLAPTAADAALSQSIIADAGLECQVCPDPESLAKCLDAGAGAILLTDEIVESGNAMLLSRALDTQPPWSEVPIVLLAGATADSSVVARSMELLGNVTILERPVRVTTLISALRTAVRARRRQYEVRDRLVDLTHAEATLRAHSEQLRDSDRRKDEFLATLAHELRNPLAPIRNALQIIHLSGNNSPAVEQARRMMERQLSQMVRLIDDLLDVSRISRGKLDLRKERIELSSVIKSAVDTAQPLIDAAGHELTLSLLPEPIYLDADPVRLAQIFSNLLNNAAKYMDRGGRIWLTTEREGKEVVVSVRDAGIGIPEDAMPAIFDMFAQVDRSLEKSQGGLGIGLTLVKQLLEMHGGRIEARSEGQGKGAEFIARLPIAAVEAVRHAANDAGERSVAGDVCRILVADDNRDAAESMSMVLRLMGNEVRTVNDGIKAVEEAQAFRPDLVLLDIGMPRLNGYDAARRIRAERWGKGILVVAMTGWGQDEDKRRAAEAGFDQHFTKPVSPADLERLIAGLRSRGLQGGVAPAL